MNVLVVGPADHPQSFAVAAAQAFASLGHRSSVFDYRRVARPFARQLPGPRWVRYPLQTYANAQLLRRVENERPDLVFIIKGELLFPETVQHLREYSYVVKWFPDDPLHFDDCIPSAPFCDILLTSSRPLVKDYASLGARVSRFWPFPIDPTYLKPLPTNPEIHKEFVFVGEATGPRASVVSQVRGHSMDIYGPGWDRYLGKNGTNGWYNESLTGTRLARTLANADIVVSMPRSVMGIHPRPFEAAACRRFCMSVAAEGLEEFFEPGKEIVLFRDSREFAQEADYFLQAPEERDAIAERAHARALRDYSYEKWVGNLLNLVRDNPRHVHA